MKEAREQFARARPHPWHGLEPGRDPPRHVTAYIELTPFDLLKYEIDKATGYLKLDRPQRTSSLPPTLYGFIPQTYCGDRVASLTDQADEGDGDPLDICVLTERPIGRAELIVPCKVVGVLRATDGGKADDKIIAILEDDPAWGEADTVDDLPRQIVERLRHYFTTYKLTRNGENQMTVHEIEQRGAALRIIEAAIADYANLAASPDNSR